MPSDLAVRVGPFGVNLAVGVTGVAGAGVLDLRPASLEAAQCPMSAQLSP
jgi:hypothetical protein